MEFSCCSRFNECDYGRNECFFAETEPDKKERCRCYQIKHSSDYIPRRLIVEATNLKPKETNEEMVQLSLFE